MGLIVNVNIMKGEHLKMLDKSTSVSDFYSIF